MRPPQILLFELRLARDDDQRSVAAATALMQQQPARRPWTFAAVCVMVHALTLLVFDLTHEPVFELLPWYVTPYLLMGACVFGPCPRGAGYADDDGIGRHCRTWCVLNNLISVSVTDLSASEYCLQWWAVPSRHRGKMTSIMDRQLRRAPDAECVLMYRLGLSRNRAAGLVGPTRYRRLPPGHRSPPGPGARSGTPDRRRLQIQTLPCGPCPHGRDHQLGYR